MWLSTFSYISCIYFILFLKEIFWSFQKTISYHVSIMTYFSMYLSVYLPMYVSIFPCNLQKVILSAICQSVFVSIFECQWFATRHRQPLLKGLKLKEVQKMRLQKSESAIFTTLLVYLGLLRCKALMIFFCFNSCIKTLYFHI